MSDAVNIKQGTILARLLATENITVTYGNFETAFFNVENRVLGLPFWNTTTDITELLIGHEIGHALYTPPDGWHNATKTIPNCPRDFINVVEDIRIEKLVLEKYPGLIPNFMRGYRQMFDQHFFGNDITPVEKMGFVSRLNIHAKMRGMVKVPFSEKELPLVKEAMAVVSWDDVLKSCRNIYDFVTRDTKERYLSAMSMAGDMAIPAESVPENEVVTMDADSMVSDGERPYSEETEEERKADSTDNQPVVNGHVRDKDAEPPVNKEPLNVVDNGNKSYVLSDRIFRSSGSSVKLGIMDMVYISPLDFDVVNSKIIGYDKAYSFRTDDVNRRKNAFVEYFNNTQKFAGKISREFEMRKQASVNARAKISPSGKLNPLKLHEYKFNDALFKQNTILPNGTRHGVFMLIDRSSSMSSSLSGVYDQLLVLTEFCRMSNIPFEVYSFMSNWNLYTLAAADKEMNKKYESLENSPTYISRNAELQHLISSKMSKKKYDSAMKAFSGKISSPKSIFLASGGTPLTNSIIMLGGKIEEFYVNNRLQKMSFVTLTDGGCGGLDIKNGSKTTTSTKYLLNLPSGNIKFSKGDSTIVVRKAIYENMRKKYNASLLNFYLCRPEGLVGADNVSSEQRIRADSDMKKNGFAVVHDSEGYDTRIFINTVNSYISKYYINGTEAVEDIVMKTLMGDSRTKNMQTAIAREIAKTIA